MKFRNIKKKVYIKKFPSNSRSIPASVKTSAGKTEYLKFSLPKINLEKLLKLYGEALKIFVAFIFVVAVTVVGYDFQKNLQIKQEIDFQREALGKDLNFWEGFIAKHQNYQDAYFQASVLEYKLGNMSKAKMYVEKGLYLDPNSENGKKIEEFLKNKSGIF